MRENILFFIWSLSAVLALAAALILLGLIVRRALLPNADQRFGDERKKLEELLVLAVSSPVDLQDALTQDISPNQRGMVLAAALDMVRSVSGSETEKISQIAENWIGRAQLNKMLDVGGRGQRIQVLTLMAYLEDEQSKECLFTHLASADPYVQLAALRGLAKRAEESELGAIFDQINAIDRTNAAFMADVLTQFGTKSVPHLLNLLPKQVDENWRAAILMALGNVGDIRHGRLIAGYSTDSSAQVRRAAAIALGELQDGDAIESLQRLAGDQRTSVRQAAITALGRIQADSAFTTLLETLDDPEWWVRFHAARTLIQTGPRGSALLQAYINTSGQHAGLAELVMKENKEFQGV